jgi:hypothetical protein
MKQMMKDDMIKLQKSLSRAYDEKEKVEVGRFWQVKAMSRIRSLGPLQVKPDFSLLFEGFLWRLAPVACALALLLGTAVFQIDPVPDYELANVFTEDPADFGLFILSNGS